MPQRAFNDTLKAQLCAEGAPRLVITKTRKLKMDYILANTDDFLHVLNAISLVFISSLAVTELIADMFSA
jgi:hypothetical protein